MTLRAVSGATLPRSLSTRSTVALPTPASRATSASFALRRPARPDCRPRRGRHFFPRSSLILPPPRMSIMARTIVMDSIRTGKSFFAAIAGAGAAACSLGTDGRLWAVTTDRSGSRCRQQADKLQPQEFVIVGGGQAGGRLAQALAGEPGRFAVTLVCQRAAPALRAAAALQGRAPRHASGWSGACIGRAAMRRGERSICASGCRPTPSIARRRRVHSPMMARLPYDVLVLATGSRLRRLTVPDSDLQGIHRCAPRRGAGDRRTLPLGKRA